MDNDCPEGFLKALIQTTESQARCEHLLNKLRQCEYRLTPQRVALVRLLAESEGHPSAAQLHEQLKPEYPKMSLATVYKTLNLLKDLDEVLELGFWDDDGRYDGKRPYPHPHLICVRCRKIVDPEIELAEHMAQQVALSSGYKIVSQRLDFYGICPACQRGA
jgi:Fur family transcriptional regulator, peroxide stress response regulator